MSQDIKEVSEYQFIPAKDKTRLCPCAKDYSPLKYLNSKYFKSTSLDPRVKVDNTSPDSENENQNKSEFISNENSETESRSEDSLKKVADSHLASQEFPLVFEDGNQGLKDESTIGKAKRQITKRNIRTIILSITGALIVTLLGVINTLHTQFHLSSAPSANEQASIVPKQEQRVKTTEKKAEISKTDSHKNEFRELIVKLLGFKIKSEIIKFTITFAWFLCFILICMRCELNKKNFITYYVFAALSGFILVAISPGALGSPNAYFFIFLAVSFCLQLTGRKYDLHIQLNSLIHLFIKKKEDKALK
jgi:hypothetical protein